MHLLIRWCSHVYDGGWTEWGSYKHVNPRTLLIFAAISFVVFIIMYLGIVNSIDIKIMVVICSCLKGGYKYLLIRSLWLYHERWTERDAYKPSSLLTFAAYILRSVYYHLYRDCHELLKEYFLVYLWVLLYVQSLGWISI